jgi:hypothetical protein
MLGIEHDPDVRLFMRPPNNKRERMYAALNSGMDDLYLCNGRIVVTGKNKAGEIINLGSVDEAATYHKGVNAMDLIERVRFCTR